MALASPKRVRTRPREVGVKQIKLELGLDHDASVPVMSFPPKVDHALMRLLAAAIIAVHQATQEVGDDDRARQS